MRLRRPRVRRIVWRMQTHTPSTQAGRLDRPGIAAAPQQPIAHGDGAATGARLFTADEVAAVLGVPRTFVYALSRRGELPTVRVGERYVRYRAQALECWIVAQESTRPKGTQ
jgi:excisionase family DNA binding protein